MLAYRASWSDSYEYESTVLDFHQYIYTKIFNCLYRTLAFQSKRFVIKLNGMFAQYYGIIINC